MVMKVMNGSDDARGDEFVVEPGTVATASTY